MTTSDTLQQHKTRDTQTLLCLDFDLTLTHLHLFSYTASMIRSGVRRDDALMNAIKLIDSHGPRGGEQFWSIMFQWLRAGHGLAITSFTSFPELPIAMLSRGIPSLRKCGAGRNLTCWLSRPIVVYGDPAPDLNPPRPLPGTWLVSPQTQPEHHKSTPISSQSPKQSLKDSSGKNAHISQALKAANLQGHAFSKVVLMDDDLDNITSAKQHGHLTIAVSRDLDNQEHLEAWQILCAQNS